MSTQDSPSIGGRVTHFRPVPRRPRPRLELVDGLDRVHPSVVGRPNRQQLRLVHDPGPGDDPPG